MRYLLFVVAALAITAVALAAPIKDIRGWSDGRVVTIEWYADDESGCSGYVVMRRSGINGSFTTITPSPMPLEEDKHYIFTDETAFRTTDNFYQYRVIPVGKSEAYDVSVTHSTSGVRRTWGSIKAMFR
jgi:hypothetical protein